MKNYWVLGWLFLSALGLVACGQNETSENEPTDTRIETEQTDDIDSTGTDTSTADTNNDTETPSHSTGDSTDTTSSSVSASDPPGTGTSADPGSDLPSDTASQDDTQTESATGGGWPGNTEHPSTVLQFGSNKPDYCNGVAVFGNAVYVVGATQGTLGNTPNPSTRLDMFLAKLDFDLNVQWIRQRGTAADELGRAVSIDETGNVYVAGTTWGSFDGNDNPMPGMGDAFVVKYDSAGKWQWTSTWATPEDDYAYSLTTSGAAVYVTGATNFETGFVKRFGNDGSEGWSNIVNVGELDIPQAVVVDKSGNVYAAGHSFASLHKGDADAFVVKFGSTGKRLDTLTFGTEWRDEIRSMVFDSLTSTLVVGGLVEDALPGNTWSGSGDAFVARIGTDLVVDWASQIGGEEFDQTHGVAVGTDGSLFGAGKVNGVFIPDDVHGDIFLSRFEPDGAADWIETWKTDVEEFANAVATSEGHVFVCASTAGTLGQSSSGDYDLAVIRLDLE